MRFLCWCRAASFVVGSLSAGVSDDLLSSMRDGAFQFIAADTCSMQHRNAQTHTARRLIIQSGICATETAITSMHTNLATNRAETVSILKGPSAHLATIPIIVPLLLLWPLSQEYNRSLIDGVGLDFIDVHQLRHVRSVDHIFIHIAAQLQDSVSFMVLQTLVAQRLSTTTCDAVERALVSFQVCVLRTRAEEHGPLEVFHPVGQRNVG